MIYYIQMQDLDQYQFASFHMPLFLTQWSSHADTCSYSSLGDITFPSSEVAEVHFVTRHHIHHSNLASSECHTLLQRSPTYLHKSYGRTLPCRGYRFTYAAPHDKRSYLNGCSKRPSDSCAINSHVFATPRERKPPRPCHIRSPARGPDTWARIFV